MNQHTPGPWQWHDDKLIAGAVLEPDYDHDLYPVVIIETDGGHYPPHGADRLLLAAAPDLLAALKLAYAELGTGRALGAASDAIEKATGRPA